MSIATIPDDEQPLLPRDQERSSKAENLSKLQPCANFLLDSDEGVWYEGKIHKNDDTSKQETRWDRMKSSLKNVFKTTGVLKKFSDFISHKFTHEVDGVPRTFCITFRKETRIADSYNNLDGIDNVFLIRLSLIEEDFNDKTEKRKGGVVLVDNDEVKLEDETPIICRGSESLKIKTKFFVRLRDIGIKVPTRENAKFSSITSGGTPNQISIVQNMQEIPTEAPNQYKEFFEKHIYPDKDISPPIQTLGDILVDHFNKCGNSPSPVSSGGGATRKHTRLTRRRKGVFKRKGKKSYKKKKYGKTKKSRRFRRSVRSRR